MSVPERINLTGLQEAMGLQEIDLLGTVESESELYLNHHGCRHQHCNQSQLGRQQDVGTGCKHEGEHRGGTCNVYRSGVARTAVVGEPSQQQRDLYRSLREVERETISQTRAGTKASQVHQAFVDAFEWIGLPVFSQAIGQGLGVEFHEFPVLNATETPELQPGTLL